MRHFAWKLFVVTAVVLTLGAVPAVSADAEDELPVAIGKVKEVYRDIDIPCIVIEDDCSGELVTVCAFPFGFLERELEEALNVVEVVIYENDCVGVRYGVLETQFPKNVAVALTYYCDGCGVEDCYGERDCDVYFEGILLRDDDLIPIPKGEEGDDAYKHKKKDKGKKDKKDK